MWRFLPGCEPPLPKKVKSNEDVSESAKNYEKNKRQCVFSKQLETREDMVSFKFFILIWRKARATSYWDGPLRIQVNWPDWPPSAGVNF